MSYFLRNINLPSTESSSEESDSLVIIDVEDKPIIALDSSSTADDSVVSEKLSCQRSSIDEIIHDNLENFVYPNQMANLNVELSLKLIPEYDGSPQNLDRFINNAEIIFKPLKVDEHTTFISIVLSRLTGKAFQIMSRKNIVTWKELKS